MTNDYKSPLCERAFSSPRLLDSNITQMDRKETHTTVHFDTFGWLTSCLIVGVIVFLRRNNIETFHFSHASSLIYSRKSVSHFSKIAQKNSVENARRFVAAICTTFKYYLYIYREKHTRDSHTIFIVFVDSLTHYTIFFCRNLCRYSAYTVNYVVFACMFMYILL